MKTPVALDSGFSAMVTLLQTSPLWVSQLSSKVEHPVSIYPNPAGDKITITFKDRSGVQTMGIYSADGRLLKTGKIVSGDSIDVGDLPSGFYYVRLGSNSDFVSKFVKR